MKLVVNRTFRDDFRSELPTIHIRLESAVSSLSDDHWRVAFEQTSPHFRPVKGQIVVIEMLDYGRIQLLLHRLPELVVSVGA